jgi:hypothetical protein
VLKAVLGEMHPDFARALYELARVCEALGKVDEARSLQAQANALQVISRGAARAAPGAAGTPVVRKATPELVPRHATVRYFSRMRPCRLYPLLVVISKDQVRDILHKATAKGVSAEFAVSTASPVVVEPVLPGCTCYPPRHEVAVEAEVARAEFHVTTLVEGTIESARVILSQNGRLLAEVPLKIRVAKTTLGWVLACLSPIVPYVLKYFSLDLDTQIQENFGLYFQIVHWVLGRVAELPWWVTGGAMLIAGITIIILNWPRAEYSPSVFWKVEVIPPEEQLREAEEALAAWDTAHGLRLLNELMQSKPKFQPAWLSA